MKLLDAAMILAVLAMPAAAQVAPTGAWSTRPAGGAGLYHGGTATDGKYLFVIGGMSATGPSAACRRFDPATGAWTTLSNLPQAVVGNVASYYDGRVYSFGSFDLGGPLKDPIFEYNTYYNDWIQTSSTVTLAAHGWDASIARIGTNLYITGGHVQTPAGVVCVNAVSRGDRFPYALFAMAPMPAAVANHASVATGGRLYVLGGVDTFGADSSACWEYDPATNGWGAKTDMNIDGSRAPRSDARAVALNSHIYVAGGRVGGIATNATLEFSPGSNWWVRRGNLNRARAGHGFVAIGSTALAYGGDFNADPTIAMSMEEFTPPVVLGVTNVRQTDHGIDIAPGGTVTSGVVSFQATILSDVPGETFRFEVMATHVYQYRGPEAPVTIQTSLQPAGEFRIDFRLPEGYYEWRYRVVTAGGEILPDVGGQPGWIEFGGGATNSAAFMDFATPNPPHEDPPATVAGGGCSESAPSGKGVMTLLVVLAVQLVGLRPSRMSVR